jgi:hypothetical protein
MSSWCLCFVEQISQAAVPLGDLRTRVFRHHPQQAYEIGHDNLQDLADHVADDFAKAALSREAVDVREIGDFCVELAEV